MRCPSCSHDNRADRRFCTECGATLLLACPECGSTTEAGEKFCGGCGARLPSGAPNAPTPTPGPDAGLPEGERRQLTVLFCDLVGSTPLSQQLDAEELRYVVVQYQKAARAAVERWGGHVAKVLGDGLLVYFGWPDAREDDPERAIRAGLAILDAMAPVNAKLAAGDGTRLAVRVGVHTGPVVIADGGEVFGETPNIAAHVQSAAEADTVVVTAATQRLVAGIFVLEDRGPQALKGVRERVPLYRVVQPSGVRSRLAIAAGRLTPFVGREVELATLVDRWERAADGEGQNVLVVGEAGVGKSRLAYQLREQLATVPHTWLECGASPYTEGTPFHPVRALVAQGLAFTDTDTAAEKVQKTTRGLRDLASAENVALLADFLGLPPPTRLPLNADVQRRKTMELLAQWNLAMSAIQPVVLLVEDLHWCDASSLELLGRLVAQSATARVLFVATARPEFPVPWPARSNLTTLQLARLTKRQAREMVTALLGERMYTETLEALVARADGVPLYVEELTKAVAEPGAARGADAIPTTLAGSLMARLDRLSTAKEVAQRAAVLGREFGYPLLAAVAEMDDTGLRQGLARLVDAEIVFQRGEPPEATYTFKHALVQEAAYESLLKTRRRELHLAVARVTTERFAARAEAEPEFLARHYEAAGLTDEAIGHYQRAGTQAHERSAHEEAIIHFRKVIALAETSAAGPERESREIRVQMALGASLMAVRGYGHAETGAAYERARMLCEAVGDRTQLASALGHLSACHFGRGGTVQALEIAERLMEIAQETGHETDLILAHSQMLVGHYHQGKFASSLAHAERLIALYDPSRHRGFTPTGPAGAGAFAACCLAHLGYPDQALARAQKAVELARSRAHPFTVAVALYFKTVVLFLRRDAESLQTTADELIAVSEAHGFPLWLGRGRLLRALASVVSGTGSSDAQELPDALALISGTGQRLGAPHMYAFRAEAQKAVGQPAEALRLVESGFAESRETAQPYWDAELHRLRGDILLRSGAEGAAKVEPLFRRAIEIARAQEARSLELRAATSLARLWRDQGKRAEARDLLAPVYGWFTEGFDTRDLIEAKALLDELG